MIPGFNRKRSDGGNGDSTAGRECTISRTTPKTGEILIQIFEESNWLFELLFVGVILLVLICQFFLVPGAIQAGGVVLCIIMFNTPVDQYISYPLNRIFDTAIGVIIGIIVNMLISRERVDRVRKFLKLRKKNK